jgi:hypothetical protein
VLADRRIIDAEELASGLQKEKRRLENLVDDMKAQLREASIGKRDDGGVKEQLWENRKEVEKLRIENEALQGIYCIVGYDSLLPFP